MQYIILLHYNFFNNLIEFLCLTHRNIFLFQTTYKLSNTTYTQNAHRMKRLFINILTAVYNVKFANINNYKNIDGYLGTFDSLIIGNCHY